MWALLCRSLHWVGGFRCCAAQAWSSRRRQVVLLPARFIAVIQFKGGVGRAVPADSMPPKSLSCENKTG